MLEREGGTFSGLVLLAFQKWWFGLQKSGTSKGYGEREISLATLEREGGTFSGLALLTFQKWCFWLQKQWHQ